MDTGSESVGDSATDVGAAVTSTGTDITARTRLAARIDDESRRIARRMLRRDTVMAVGFLVVLWVAYAVVAVAVRNVIADHVAYIMALVCMGVIVVYNTGAVTAMVLNMRRDSVFIYMRDILNLRGKRVMRR